MRRTIGLIFRCFARLVMLAPLGCERSSPPAPDVADPSTAPIPAPFDASFAQALMPQAQGSAGTPSAVIGDGGGAPSLSAIASASTVDPSTLPQTNDKPHASGPAFDARVAGLWKAIVTDDPDAAMPFFFPVHAYEQVKAIANPSGDWRRRLVANFTRDIHRLHARLGDDASRATFTRIDVPDDRSRWVDPNEESNKLGYYRVYGTRILYEIDGKSRTIDVTSLISWRGEWYCVHLAGFK